MTNKIKPILNAAESDALLAQKSIWAVYRLSWKLPFPFAIILPTTLLFMALLTFALTGDISNSELVAFVRNVLELGITFSSTILGFLIAGFTVFATLTNPILFVKLAKIKDADSNLTWLKVIFVVFMHTFSHYVSFLILSITSQLISQPHGILSWIIHHYFNNPELLKGYLLAFAFATFSSWLFFLTLLLARFIFNIYNACMLTIAANGEGI